MPSQQYAAGGYDSQEAYTKGMGFAEGVGRIWNNLSGTTASNQFNMEQAAVARQFESEEAQKARDFEERMSNTAYQRAAADMRAAGINPATLSGMASGGSAASTPSGSAASGHAASSSGGSGFGAVLGSLFSAVVGGMLIGSRIKASHDVQKAAKALHKAKPLFPGIG